MATIPPLRPLQAKAVEWLVEHGSGMECDPVGSGKTRAILEALDRLGVRKAIVATTASMSGAWRNEANRLAQLQAAGLVTKQKEGRNVTWSVTEQGRKYASYRNLTPTATFPKPVPETKESRMAAYRKERAETEPASPPPP